MSIGGETKTPETKKLPAELTGSKIGELCDAVYGTGVKLLVALGSAQVSLKDGETEVVLLLRGVGLSEPFLEAGEVVLGVEKLIVAVRYDLANQKVIVAVFFGSNSGG